MSSPREAKGELDDGVAATGSSVCAESAIFKFHSTVEEVAKAYLHDVFLLVQPSLTRAVKAIFVIKFGEDEWLSHYKSHLGSSMQEFAVDDGRAFDMCVRNVHILILQCCAWPRHLLNSAAGGCMPFLMLFLADLLNDCCKVNGDSSLQLFLGRGASRQHI